MADPVVRGSQTAAELENAAMDAFDRQDRVTLLGLLDRNRDVVTRATAEQIVGHNRAFNAFCKEQP